MDLTFSRYRLGAIIALIPYPFFIFYRQLTLPEWFPFTKPDLGFFIPAALAIFFLFTSLYLSYRHSRLMGSPPLTAKRILIPIVLGVAGVVILIFSLFVIAALA